MPIMTTSTGIETGMAPSAAVPPTAAPDTTVATAPPIVWHPAKRIGFRFLAVYFVLYAMPFPLDQLPWLGDRLSQWIDTFWKKVGPWVGSNVLGLEGEMFIGPTGSGDTTLDYVKLLLMVVIAVVAVLVWSGVDRRRLHYDRASRWLVVGCRYYLAAVMLSYGLVKVIPTQFTEPSLARLMKTFGDASPMGMVWTFMGMSPAYTIFSGLAETLGGLLLAFRPTRNLGAMVSLAVMTNVAALNYFYDVPVKLFSSHLVVMAVALILLDARRLYAFFVRNTPVAPAPDRHLFASRRGRLVGRALALLLVGSIAHGALSRAWEMHHSFGNARPKPAIWGIYDVQSFVRDGEAVPPLLTDETRWRALILDRVLPMSFGGGFERPGSIGVQLLDGTVKPHSVVLDETASTITILPPGQMSLEAAAEADVEITDVLRYDQPEPGRLVIRGTWQGSGIEVEMTARDLTEMELTGRGFHWINEYPRNR